MVNASHSSGFFSLFMFFIILRCHIMYPFSPPRLQINLAKCSSIPAAFSDQTEPTEITIPGDSALGGHMINKALIFLPSIVLVAGDYIILYNPIQKSRHIP